MKIIFSEEITGLAAVRGNKTKSLLKLALKRGEELNSLVNMLSEARRRAMADDKAAATDEAAALRVAGANIQAGKLEGKISDAKTAFDSACMELQQCIAVHNHDVWTAAADFVRGEISASIRQALAPFYPPMRPPVHNGGVPLFDLDRYVNNIAAKTESWQRSCEITARGVPHRDAEAMYVMQFSFGEIEALRLLANGELPKLAYVFFDTENGEQPAV